jgi:hypothetical protein
MGFEEQDLSAEEWEIAALHGDLVNAHGFSEEDAQVILEHAVGLPAGIEIKIPDLAKGISIAHAKGGGFTVTSDGPGMKKYLRDLN